MKSSQEGTSTITSIKPGTTEKNKTTVACSEAQTDYNFSELY